MRIVIDLQAAQTPNSSQRGIGRYSLALAKAMARQRGEHEIIVALNGMFEESIGRLRAAFEDLLPAGAIRVWHATIPPMGVNGGPPGTQHAAQCVREAFLASLQPDVVHVTSVFESSPFAVTEFTHDVWPARTAVTLYDLIPLVNADVYLDSPAKREGYAAKLESVRRADLLLAISESSRQEAITHLGSDPGRVVTISSDADPHFAPADVPASRREDVLQRHGLQRPFAMYTGGIDHRKNVEGLIRAWALLPSPLRAAHQLAIVCAVKDDERERLEALALQLGLEPPRDVVLTGFVSEDDLVDLYRLCRLFVFPSLHEGFGLPALEAMRCGAPVIGASNSSIAEVIGWPDAMFDAASPPAMASLIERGLADDAFRAELLVHGREQSRRFSWDESARRAIAAMEALVSRSTPVNAAPPPKTGARRPRLAFVTPLPPERSGIADSSADLLPCLAEHYDIDIVVDQDRVDVPRRGWRARRTPHWFDEHAHEYDRIVYQFGNSSFHDFEFPLLARHPGTVILHDFFLSGVLAQHEIDHPREPVWSRALYRSHGWRAVAERMHASDLVDVIWRYPANFDVLTCAHGVIVHSRHAMELASGWYGAARVRDWVRVPLLRSPAAPAPRALARLRLSIAADAFVVCSFGHMGPTKLNMELVRAWVASPLAAARECVLVFVGEANAHGYGDALQAELTASGANVRITGWVDATHYTDWLSACDLAVQLRTMSRGETSAAVLDCMNFGVATIANREGSMADLDERAVWLLPREFSVDALADALSQLWRDPARREEMGRLAREIVARDHAPAACAAAYAAAIESFDLRRSRGTATLVRQAGRALPWNVAPEFVAALARGIGQTFPTARPTHQLFVTVRPPLVPGESHEGLSPLIVELIRTAPRRWRIEPVYLDAQGRWRHARRYTLHELACPPGFLDDDLVEVQTGDVWAMPAGADHELPSIARQLAVPRLRLPSQGDAALIWAAVRSVCAEEPGPRWWMDLSELVVRDWGSGIQRVVKNHLIELLLDPPEGVQVVPVYARADNPGYRIAASFLLQLAGVNADGLRDERVDVRAGDLFFGLDLQPQVVPAQREVLASYAAKGVKLGFLVHDLLPIRLPQFFRPGAADVLARWARVVATADIAVCVSQATADDLQQWLREQGWPVPAMVRTVHNGADLGHVLGSRGLPPDAEHLIAHLRDAPAFLMVGTIEPRKGHAAVLAAMERLWSAGEEVSLVIAGHAGWMVDDLIERLRHHEQRDRRLFWIEDASDEFLQRIYGACAALVAASHGEGFGLPLVEAAQHDLPLIARNLPVFREIAGEHASYFSDDAPDALAAFLARWLARRREGAVPRSKALPRLTWAQSARQLRHVLLEASAHSVGAGTSLRRS